MLRNVFERPQKKFILFENNFFLKLMFSYYNFKNLDNKKNVTSFWTKRKKGYIVKCKNKLLKYNNLEFYSLSWHS